jgi:CRISPR-associated endonuclease/helicase Cas3
MTTSTDFAKFYHAVHGHDPFPWQERLAREVLSTGWPNSLSIPTACGKTSTIDIAVFSLAAQAELPAPQRTAPLRIFFVIDRRLVVDDVTRHAQKLANTIAQGGQPVVDWVRERLLLFGTRQALQIATLRGGMYRNNTWADMPNQPLVVVSTVDQVGSRLLFRGYGVNERGWPVHAGLVANDSLMIVDEAHLSQPFLDTVGRVCGYQDKEWVNEQWRVTPPLRLVSMSATGRGTGTPFKLHADDYESALKKRLEVEKLAELREISDLENTAAQEALARAKRGAGVVGVVLNTVSSARKVFEALKAHGEPEENRILLTGRVRPYDRDRLLHNYLDRIKAGRQPPDNERLFVIATQTVEVGADLDFDALVTEAAPLDSLRQRFGRLNRIGRAERSDAVILKPKRSKSGELIYGVALEKTWNWLGEHATEQAGARRIDFGVRRMQELFESEADAAALNTSTDRGPLMFPAHVDAWVQTNPPPVPDPNVAPFLHGPEALEAADVQIVWRADLPKGLVHEWPEILAVAPPVSTEALPLPIGMARRWLREQTGDTADVEGAVLEGTADERNRLRDFLIWRGPDKSKIRGLAQLRPGDTVVVQSDEGGTDQFGWNPQSGPVQDIGDLCANERASMGLGRFRLRLHPQVLFPNDPEQQKTLNALLDKVANDEEEAWGEARQLVRSTVPEINTSPKRYGQRWLIGVSAWPKRASPRTISLSPDEAEEDETASLTDTIPLEEHTRGVADLAKLFAGRCGLPDWAARAVEYAARMHDYGKCDQRFQMLLDPLCDLQRPLAKGRSDLPAAELQRRIELSGYPKNARHEFGSVAIAESCLSWPKEADRDLVLYLIGTHHGYGRALAPFWSEEPGFEVQARVNGETVTVKDVDRIANIASGWVDRFWRLQRKYGWWGLAYLEAILRRADCVRSREEQEAK